MSRNERKWRHKSCRVGRILRQEHDMNQIIFSHLFDHIFMRHSKEQASKRTKRIYLSVEYILVAMFCLAEHSFFSLSVWLPSLERFVRNAPLFCCFAKEWKTGEKHNRKRRENDKNKQFLRGPQCTLSRCVFTPVCCNSPFARSPVSTLSTCASRHTETL